MRKISLILILLGLFQSVHTQSMRAIDVPREGRFLNLPVDMGEPRHEMVMTINGKEVYSFQIRLASRKIDYWVYTDLARLPDGQLSIHYPKASSDGLNKIYTAERWAGQDSVYQERYRPQFHFSSKRGWNNDPNGLVFHDGLYHMFYQHNPFEIHWENMHWGHAVSTDLLHWDEQGESLYPDQLGTMFSGTATIDFNNSLGLSPNGKSAIVAAYTAHEDLGAEKGARQTQCIAYSLDGGASFTKYAGNPVIDSKDKWNSSNTRDPKIFWHDGTAKWIMVLFEKDGHSIYNSDDLVNWTYLSHITGFWECPELFELSIDGNSTHTQWVMYGASGTYMLGNFDGSHFYPATGKLKYVEGNFYAAQTFNNIRSSDGRRIQVGWGRGLDHYDEMPFGQMMLFPTELTLRSTRNGIRLYNYPIRELSQLYTSSSHWDLLNEGEANQKLSAYTGDLIHFRTKVRIVDGTSFSISFRGNEIVRYDMNYNTVNGSFYSSDLVTDGTIILDVLLDKTSIEIFVDNGAYTVVDGLSKPVNNSGLLFNSGRSSIEIVSLDLHELESIW